MTGNSFIREWSLMPVFCSRGRCGVTHEEKTISIKTYKKMAFINQAARREQTNTVMWKHSEVKISSWWSKMLQVAEPQPEAPLPVVGSASLLVAQGTTSDCWPPPHFYCDVAPNSSHPIVCNCSVPISPGAFLAEICKQNDCHLWRFCFWFFHLWSDERKKKLMVRWW